MDFAFNLELTSLLLLFEKNTILIVNIMLLILIISFSGCILRNENHGGRIFEGLEISFEGTHGINLNLLGLNDSSIKNLTSTTFKLNLKIKDLNFSENFSYLKSEKYIYPKNDEFFIDKENIEFNYQYLFLIEFLIESVDSRINNITLFGNNTIKGILTIDNSYKANVTLEKIYSDIETDDNNSFRVELILPYDQKMRFHPLVTIID